MLFNVAFKNGHMLIFCATEPTREFYVKRYMGWSSGADVFSRVEIPAQTVKEQMDISSCTRWHDEIGILHAG